MEKAVKIKNYLLAAIIFGLLLSCIPGLTACEQINGLKDKVFNSFNSKASQDEAVIAVKGFFEAVVADDLDEAFKYVYIPQAEGVNKDAKTSDDFKKEFNSITKIVSFEINRVEVKNNIAMVNVDLIDTYDGEEKIYKDMQVSLVKDSEETWKINFWE
jgi:hypothetical protein